MRLPFVPPLRHVVLVSTCLLTGAATAMAQPPEPPGPFVVDLRGAYSSVGRSDALASPRGLTSGELPKTVKGLDVGVHGYPVRGTVTLGVGASLLMIGGTQAGGTDETTGAALTEGEFRVRGVMPQLSLNFGSSRGWSYLGAGLGLAQVKAGRAESDLSSYSPSSLTLNIGGGARWFIREHMAFTFDGRFYRIGAKPLDGDYLGHPVTSMFVLSAGLSFK